MEEIEVTVGGRVQMVMYRDFAQRKARSLGLAGFVRNNKDGTVTVVAQGQREMLQRYITLLQKGSIFSRVDSTDTTWRPVSETYIDFLIQR